MEPKTDGGPRVRHAWLWPIVGVTALASTVATQDRQAGTPPAFSVVEASIPDLRKALEEGRATSVTIVRQYLDRLARYDGAGQLNAALSLSPTALQQAAALDRERAAGDLRGPLHGIPIAVKDNIQTRDMPTTGGTLAFTGFVPPYEAALVRQLRDAGAIILAKTSMTELANWVAGRPTPMPNGFSALGGFSMNPYDPRPDPRPGRADGRPVLDVGGSSSGIGTAASFWAASVGTETSGSILSPANQTMLVAVKPTVGRVSRHGIIPVSLDQDTAGPMARSVTDAAILLGVLEGATSAPEDPAAGVCPPPPAGGYATLLRADALAGARIGIPRPFFVDPVPIPGGGRPVAVVTSAERERLEEAVEVLRDAGAVVVDPAAIPSVVASDPEDSLLAWDICAGAGEGPGEDDGCSTVLKYGMKRDFDRWLGTLGPGAPVRSLSELRAFNATHRDDGALRYGQSRLDISDAVDLERDRPRYLADRAKDLRLTATEGIDAALEAHDLDALVFPGYYGSAIAARPGYPTVMVPFGTVVREPRPPFPEAFEVRPTPFGVSFTGRACAEPDLLALAYAFEQVTRRRVPPLP